MNVRMAWVVGALALASPVFAQAPAPRESVSAVVGGKKVSIEYGRPALKGRDLAELLKQLPPDKVWRAGSEQVTTLSTEGALLVGDKKVPAGKYSLYVVVADDGTRSLLLNGDPGVPLGEIWKEAPADLKNAPWPRMGPKGYAAVADKEVARVKLDKAALAEPADLFTIQLGDTSLTMSWGKESWSTKLAAGS